MIYKYSVKMTLEHVDSNNNVLSSGSLIVGKANNLDDAQSIAKDTKYSFVDKSYEISNKNNVDYKRKRVDTNNFLAMVGKKSVRESIKNIEIIQNFR